MSTEKPRPGWGPTNQFHLKSCWLFLLFSLTCFTATGQDLQDAILFDNHSLYRLLLMRDGKLTLKIGSTGFNPPAVGNPGETRTMEVDPETASRAFGLFSSVPDSAAGRSLLVDDGGHSNLLEFCWVRPASLSTVLIGSATSGQGFRGYAWGTPMDRMKGWILGNERGVENWPPPLRELYNLLISTAEKKWSPLPYIQHR